MLASLARPQHFRAPLYSLVQEDGLVSPVPPALESAAAPMRPSTFLRGWCLESKFCVLDVLITCRPLIDRAGKWMSLCTHPPHNTHHTQHNTHYTTHTQHPSYNILPSPSVTGGAYEPMSTHWSLQLQFTSAGSLIVFLLHVCIPSSHTEILSSQNVQQKIIPRFQHLFRVCSPDIIQIPRPKATQTALTPSTLAQCAYLISI